MATLLGLHNNEDEGPIILQKIGELLAQRRSITSLKTFIFTTTTNHLESNMSGTVN